MKFTDQDAIALKEVMRSIGDECSGKEIVDAARDESSPIHHLFEWNDEIAAEGYRVYQANYYVRKIKVVIATPDGPERVREFHSVRIRCETKESREFAPLERIRLDPGLSDQVVNRALNELIAWKRKYMTYRSIFSGVFDAIQAAITNVNVSREEETKDQRKCPECGKKYFRTHCPNPTCRTDGIAPETIRIESRKPVLT